MTGKSTSKEKVAAQSLRKHAEELLRAKFSDGSEITTADVSNLIHELGVHQIELEMQNEELRDAQIELSRSRDRFSDLYNFAPVGYVTLDKKGKVLEANLRAVSMLGVERHDLLQSRITKFVATQKQDEFYLYMQAVFSSPEKQVGELEMKSADGSPMTIRLESVAQVNNDQEQCQTILTDVSALRNTHQRLKENEQRLSLALRSGHMGTWEIDTRYNLLKWDKTQFEIFGLSEKTNITRNSFLEYVFPADRKKLIQARKDCLSDGKEFQNEFRITKPDGQIRWLAGNGMPIRDGQNRIVGMIGVNYDITPAKEASTALQDSEERLRLTLDTMKEGVLTTNPKGVILDINKAVERIFGYSRQEIIGQNLEMVVRELDASKSEALLAGNAFLEGLSDRDFSSLDEKVGLGKDGSRIPIEVSVDFITRNGIFIYLLHDITEKRRLEQEILRISEDEKRDLAHTLHDSLCQELSGLGYMTATLAETLESESHSDAKQAKRISEKIGEVMESARQLSHSLDPLMESPNALSSALRLLASTASDVFNMDCHFRSFGKINLKDAAIAINLYRIAQEAVHNAYRHGKAKNITITFKKEDGIILLKILDNGLGLPDEQDHGEGIGLRVMKYRAATLGGWIDIRNRKNRGVSIVCGVPKSNPDELKQFQ